MSEWQGYDLSEFPELNDPEDTIREALRDTIGDGEGIDDAVMRKFKSKIESDVLREAAEESDQITCEKHGGNDWFPSEWVGQVGGWLQRRADRIEEEA